MVHSSFEVNCFFPLLSHLSSPPLPCFPLFLPPQMHRSFHLLAIGIIFLVWPDAVVSVDLRFKACRGHSCGNGPNISYPFWIDKRNGSLCGLPGYKVTCKGKNPVLGISSDEYIIKDIFYSNNSLLLASKMAHDFDNPCPIPQHNFSIEGTPFRCSFSYVDLFFFYSCTKYPIEQTYSIRCASNSTHFSFAVFHKEILEFKNYSIESCHSWVKAPAEAEHIGKLLRMNFTDVLRKGFVLQWDENHCAACRRSGGRCGSDNRRFTCFCPDRPHSRACNDDKVTWQVKLVIGLAAGGATIFIMGLVLLVYYRRDRRKEATPAYSSSKGTPNCSSSMEDPEKAGSFNGIQLFSYNELQEATNNFDSRKEVGDGGYGSVYKGKLQDGRFVAVKRLYDHNYKRVEQFMNEVEILTRLRHQNLVTLYGCTSRQCHELLLVYEYIPNGTVADHLHGDRAKPGSVSWGTRMSIAIETARALAYLHASDIIHRDVKTSNILLDNNFCIKVADFGLSRLFPSNATHVSTAPQGTPGYVDPEYHECYQLTDKSDVYSFGVVLVELISSKPAVDITRHRHEINLSNMAISKIENKALHELVDPWLGFEEDCKARKMITEVAELAFRCLQLDRDLRPSMAEVLEALDLVRGGDCNGKYAEEEVDVPAAADDAVLLNSDPPTLSPDSGVATWISSGTTSTSTG
ncbi:LEAF RUST 10 DISEASE-RESISTANCE LOCUS RECEPTOR-LIKE PROTEIN KINASE-like 1.2 [Diospyros lotus]|uniref:LEAF RUST 10 DISEASE-RESISTANCE LOCUS RECEPTOR-LIKE PROTEIN KINASE-like 1.2 n=1 Tax=Diospyros lotus TaxID=55363 RepID=UPI002254AAB6|nr:LEAF RUST 10 DISEASE-RESISTANCE LOCUS RECEPTOR-LIKE PROTEIN KINASE-like 1.2 [Diospyros lotus]